MAEYLNFVAKIHWMPTYGRCSALRKEIDQDLGGAKVYPTTDRPRQVSANAFRERSSIHVNAVGLERLTSSRNCPYATCSRSSQPRPRAASADGADPSHTGPSNADLAAAAPGTAGTRPA